MSEPVIPVPVSAVLARIEGKLDMQVEKIHAIELALASSSATVVAENAATAADRARSAVWVAAGSVVASAAAVIVAFVRH